MIFMLTCTGPVFVAIIPAWGEEDPIVRDADGGFWILGRKYILVCPD